MASLPYDERLERLLSTAAKVFAAKGFHPTTMRELSRATGMSLAGMYHYVQGKDELLYLIQQRCFTRGLDGATTALAGAPDPIDRLQRFIAHHVAFFAEHMDEMKVLSHEAQSLSARRQSAITRLKRQYVNLLQDVLNQVSDNSGAQLDTTVATYALFGMMNWMYNWYDPDGPISPETLAVQFTDIVLHGVAPSPTSVSHGG